jgi:hypothetical protein
MATSQGQKYRSPLYHSQINREAQQKERKLKRDEMKKK